DSRLRVRDRVGVGDPDHTPPPWGGTKLFLGGEWSASPTQGAVVVNGAGGAGRQGCGTEAVNGASGGVPGPEARRGEGRRLRVDGDSIRLALSISEACEALGVSWDFWSEHIAPEVRVV